MEFGPEIKVDGKRPEWLDGYTGPVRWWNEDQLKGITCDKAATLNWGPYPGYTTRGAITSFALPANHPHYATPTPDERAVAPELVERMRKLVEMVESVKEQTVPSWFPAIWDEAHTIFTTFNPVDEDLVEAEKVVAQYEWETRTGMTSRLNKIALDVAVAALARGRQLEKEGK